MAFNFDATQGSSIFLQLQFDTLLLWRAKWLQEENYHLTDNIKMSSVMNIIALISWLNSYKIDIVDQRILYLILFLIVQSLTYYSTTNYSTTELYKYCTVREDNVDSFSFNDVTSTMWCLWTCWWRVWFVNSKSEWISSMNNT